MSNKKFEEHLKLLEPNIEIFHDSVFGIHDIRFLKHIRDVMSELKYFKGHNKTTHINKLVDFLDDYGNTAN